MGKTMTDFKKVFKFPLKGEYGIVFTNDDERAFDWPNQYSYPNRFPINRSARDLIISVINGNGNISVGLNLALGIDINLYYDPARTMIYANINGEKREFISIRGWGYLTGTGGLKLDDNTAANIQNDFAKYIITRINQAAV